MNNLYKDVFTSEKIKPKSKILVMSPDKNYDFITQNLFYIIKLDLKIDLVDKNFKIEHGKYDLIIFNNIFSNYDNDYVGEILMMYKPVLKEYGSIIFINELIEYNRQYYHPLTLIKNILFTITRYNFGKTISITDMYRYIQECGIHVFDCYRIFSADIITYPVQIFMISARFKN